MTIMTVLTAPDPTLKRVSTNIVGVDSKIRQLMDDMLETMYNNQGIGLAAPQVGVSKRVVVLDLREAEREGKALQNYNHVDDVIYPLYMANPVITIMSDEIKVEREGCLSLPDQGIDVGRYNKILVTYLDYNNSYQQLEASGLLARAIQHEVDHLNGILLIDYLSILKKDTILRKLSKAKRYSSIR